MKLIKQYAFYFLFLTTAGLLSNALWGDKFEMSYAYYMSAILLIVVEVYKRVSARN